MFLKLKREELVDDCGYLRGVRWLTYVDVGQSDRILASLKTAKRVHMRC